MRLCFGRSIVASLAVLAVLLLPAAGAAGAEVTRGFGDPYGGPDSAILTHRGLDLAQPALSVVTARAAGVVVFAGYVPTRAGERVIAVTVLDEFERKWTYLPLERCDVSQGDHVAEAAPLGRLAPAGDPSSPEPHVHVSVREGEAYVDPSPLLLTSGAVPVEHPVVQPVGAAAGALEQQPTEGVGAADAPLVREPDVDLGDGLLSAPAAEAAYGNTHIPAACGPTVATAASPSSRVTALGDPLATSASRATPITAVEDPRSWDASRGALAGCAVLLAGVAVGLERREWMRVSPALDDVAAAEGR